MGPTKGGPPGGGPWRSSGSRTGSPSWIALKKIQNWVPHGKMLRVLMGFRFWPKHWSHWQMMSPTKNRISSCWSVRTVAYASDCFKVLRQFHLGTLVMFDEQRLVKGNQGSTSPLKNLWIGPNGPNGPNHNEKHRKTKQFGSLYGEWDTFFQSRLQKESQWNDLSVGAPRARLH